MIISLPSKDARTFQVQTNHFHRFPLISCKKKKKSVNWFPLITSTFHSILKLPKWVSWHPWNFLRGSRFALIKLYVCISLLFLSTQSSEAHFSSFFHYTLIAVTNIFWPMSAKVSHLIEKKRKKSTQLKKKNPPKLKIQSVCLMNHLGFFGFEYEGNKEGKCEGFRVQVILISRCSEALLGSFP